LPYLDLFKSSRKNTPFLAVNILRTIEFIFGEVFPFKSFKDFLFLSEMKPSKILSDNLAFFLKKINLLLFSVTL